MRDDRDRALFQLLALTGVSDPYLSLRVRMWSDLVFEKRIRTVAKYQLSIRTLQNPPSSALTQPFESRTSHLLKLLDHLMTSNPVIMIPRQPTLRDTTLIVLKDMVPGRRTWRQHFTGAGKSQPLTDQ